MRITNHMKITAKRDEVLQTLRANRETHSKIVLEARAGYIEKAKAELLARLDELKGNKVVSLVFGLELPMDQTKVYDVAIRMLEMHQEDTLVLDGGQVQNLMMDEWDWTEQFYASNFRYSATAALIGSQR